MNTMDDKVTQKIALVRAQRNVSKVLKDLDMIAQDVDNVRPSVQGGCAAQLLVAVSAQLEASRDLLASLYEKDYP